MASGTCTLLFTVADTFIEQGKPLQAIKCLQAICISPRQELPQVEAEVRVKLAELLLRYTHNIKDANKMLVRADLVLKKVKGYNCLKCAVLTNLFQCHKYLGATRLQIGCCDAGLEICRQGSSSPEREELQKWALQFYTSKADAASTSSDSPTAIACLEAAVSVAKGQSWQDTVALLQLGVLQLRLEEGDTSLVAASFQAAAEAVAAVDQYAEGQIAHAHLKLHFEILRDAWLLSRGDTLALQKKDSGQERTDPTSVATLSQLSKKAAEASESHHYSPTTLLPALAETVAAAIMRPTGKMSKAQEHLNAASLYLMTACESSGVDLEVEEKEVPMQHRSLARQLAWLQMLIFENMCIIAVTQKELGPAGRILAQLIGHLEKHPSVLSRQNGVAHLLAGAYCIETQSMDAAAAHFLRAAECAKDLQTRRLGAAQAALSMLLLEGSSAHPKALELLKQHNLFCASSADLPPLEGAAGHYATAMVLLAQGKLSEGRSSIMKALKLAHAPLHNHQLVAKVMCALAPTYFDSDLPAVQAMTNTALSLSKGLYDLPTQIIAAEHTLEHMKRSGSTDRLKDQENYIKRKKDAYKQAVGAATANAERHAAILRWDLTSMDMSLRSSSQRT